MVSVHHPITVPATHPITMTAMSQRQPTTYQASDTRLGHHAQEPNKLQSAYQAMADGDAILQLSGTKAGIHQFFSPTVVMLLLATTKTSPQGDDNPDPKGQECTSNLSSTCYKTLEEITIRISLP
jgi:hypothetical protein